MQPFTGHSAVLNSGRSSSVVAENLNSPRTPAAPSAQHLRLNPSSSGGSTAHRALCGVRQRFQGHSLLKSHRCTPRRQFVGMTVAAADDGAKPSVGWLGLGTLGTPMVQNLVNAGYDVTVWNRSPKRCEPLVDAGAKMGKSPKEVAASCDVTFAVVSDPEAAVEVATGPEGVAAGISAGKGYVDVSTIDVSSAQQIAEAIRAAGAQYLEAPVSGSKQPAEKGQLIFLTGGDKELFERVTPLLDIMGKKSFFLGDVGQGARMKLVINMIMGSMMASFAEGLVLAKDTGLSQQDLLEATGLGAIAAPMFAMKGPSMQKGEFPPAFPLKHQQKDLRLALELADSVDQPLPVAAAANSAYLKAMEAGLGDQDFSAVLAALTQK